MGSVIAFSAVGTFVIAKFLDMTMGLRVSEEVEYAGLDVSLHGERVYIGDADTVLDLTDSAQEAAAAQEDKTVAP